ncbi:MAG: transposase [Ktedonobacteraceae bacterium]
MLLKRAYKYRLYPSKKQQEKLQGTLDRVRELYNAALQERRDAYDIMVKRHPSYYDEAIRKQLSKEHAIGYNQQANQLPDIKVVREEYREIHSQVLQDILHRVQKAFDDFLQRVKEGKTPGYPRYKGKDHFDSFCYPQSGFSVTEDTRICLSKIGTIKVKMHRTLKGTLKTCTIKREGEHWYVVLVCDVEQETVYHASEEAVGIDLGLLHFATLSDGRTIENPRYLRQAQAKLARAQQRVAKKQRGSKRRKKAGKLVGKAHRKVANQRRDFLYKESHTLVKTYATIVFEDLSPGNMSRRPKPKKDEETGEYLPNGAAAKAGLNKSIRDAGWGQFVHHCQNKAEEAGSRVLLVNPTYTSQRCSACGAIKKKTLDERWHSCPCGCELDRDHNSALDILRLGLEGKTIQKKPPRLRRTKKKRSQARTEPSGDALLRSPRL